MQQNTLQIPPPRPGITGLPLVGPEIHAAWQLAHDDLPALVKSLQPKIGDLAKAALGMVASIGGGILAFVAAFIIAGIIMAFGEGGDRASRAIFARVVGAERGDEFTTLSVATIRAVALGVIGIAFIETPPPAIRMRSPGPATTRPRSACQRVRGYSRASKSQ